MLEKLEFKKLREFGEIINDTFLFIKQNFKSLIKVFVYFCGFFLIASMISAIMYTIGAQKVMRDPTNAFNIGRLYELFSWNYLLLIIFSVANYTAVNVSILSFIAIYIKNGNVAPTIEEVWAYFKYYFFRVFGSSFIVFVFTAFAFMLCLIPGVYVFPAMCLLFPVMVFENGSFGYSFGRSFRLLRDQWWVTAGAIFVLFIITYACMSFASLPAIVINMVGAFTQGEKGLSNSMIIISTVIQYVCQVFLILPTIGISLCYYNLAERLDGEGLMSRINEFGETKDAFNGPEEY